MSYVLICLNPSSSLSSPISPRKWCQGTRTFSNSFANIGVTPKCRDLAGRQPGVPKVVSGLPLAAGCLKMVTVNLGGSL